MFDKKDDRKVFLDFVEFIIFCVTINESVLSGSINMTLTHQITYVLTALAGVALYGGLDKLAALFLLLLFYTLFTLGNGILDDLNDPQSKLAAYIFRNRSLENRQRPRLWLVVLANLAGLAFGGFLLLQIGALSFGDSLSVNENYRKVMFYLAVCVGLIFYTVFAVRALQEKTPSDLEIRWYRAIGYFSGYHFLLFAVFFFSMFLPESEAYRMFMLVDYGFFFGFLTVGLLGGELMVGYVRNIVALYQSRNDEFLLPFPFFINFFAAEESLKASLVKSIETISGVDVSRSEIVDFCLKIFEPVCVVSLIIIWLITSLVIVSPDKEAVFLRFGHIVDKKVFGPGLYIKLPWPFTEIRLFETGRVNSLNVGFEPDPEHRDIIWTKPHAIKYFDLIVGDGIEIIAIDCQVMYRVDDRYSYITALQNPEDFISASTYRLLTRETVSSKFDDIIARDRNTLSSLIREKLQQMVDEKKLGVKIVEVVFLAMHPPLEVADDFEDIISAQIDKLTYVLKANTENSFKLSMNKAMAKGKELEAESYAANHVAKAAGESSSFASRTLGYEIDPELTSFRLRYDRLQQVLEGKTLYIIDHSLMRKDDRIFLDLNQER